MLMVGTGFGFFLRIRSGSGQYRPGGAEIVLQYLLIYPVLSQALDKTKVKLRNKPSIDVCDGCSYRQKYPFV